MAGLAVRPSYQLTETDILTVDKINLMATPVVDLSLETPVNDQNYFRNGNFYSSFWANPAGVPVPPTSWVGNADYWLCSSAAGTPTYQRSTDVPDLFSLFSAQIVGAAGVGVVEFGSQISGDLSATLRRRCTFSGYMENKTGQVLSPQLLFYTCGTFNNFNTVSLRATIDLQTCANAMWTYVTASLDVSTLTNAANGLLIAVMIPAGSLAATTQTVNFSRLKFQIGDVATEFSDDPSLFIQTPSIGPTDLQDGCIARPALFAPNVIPQGAFAAGAIQTADIGDHQVTGAKLSATAITDSLTYTPINKAGDTGVGVIGFTQDTPVLPSGIPSIVISTTSGNASNPSFDPAIGFSRTGVNSRFIGLTTNRRFQTMDDTGVAGFLLDTVTGVDQNSYQNASITYAKLAQSLIDIISPIGMVICYAGPASPASNWIVCDGTAISRTQFSVLFSRIGTYWGAGDNINTFNVPDFRGRAPIGYVSSPAGGITARAFGSRGGEENHVLTVSELASHNHGTANDSHTHTATDSGHTHGIPTTGGMGPTSGGALRFVTGPAIFPSNAGSAQITVAAAASNVTINANGSNAGHNTMMPFAVAYYFIRAL